jgi:hypothetical protein
MSERDTRPGSHPPYELTNFVIDNVSSYEDLNAPTLEEADGKFKTAVAEALLANPAEDVLLGEGAHNTVHGLKDDDRVVIKRLRTGGYAEDSAELGRYWQKIQDDHKTALAHFGRGFVPDTEFWSSISVWMEMLSPRVRSTLLCRNKPQDKIFTTFGETLRYHPN